MDPGLREEKMKPMHMMWAVLVGATFAPTASAQQDFWQRIHVRHNLNSTKEVAQPAFLQGTAPREGRTTGAAGIGVRYDLVQHGSLTVGPFGEFLWNTMTDKEQDALRLGLDAEWQVWELGPDGRDYTAVVLGQLNTKRDAVAHTKAVQLTGSLTPVFTNRRWPAPNTTWGIGRIAEVSWSPAIGFVVDHIRAAAADSLEGTIVRATAQADVIVYPAATELRRRIEIAGRAAYQGDVFDPTRERDNRHPYLKASLNLYLFNEPDRAAGFGFSYVNGEDPTKGFAEQRFWQFGIVFRVK